MPHLSDDVSVAAPTTYPCLDAVCPLFDAGHQSPGAGPVVEQPSSAWPISKLLPDKHWHWLALITSILALVTGLLMQAPVAGRAVSSTPLAGLTLIDQNGSQVPLASLQGNTVLMNFIFTHCAAVCPTQTRQLVTLYKAIPRERMSNVRFVSVSIDPIADSPEQLAAYARRLGADLDHWLFLTGSKKEVAKLTAMLHVDPEQQDQVVQNDHSTALYLFSRDARMMQRYAGVTVDIKRLAEEIPQLDALHDNTKAP